MKVEYLDEIYRVEREVSRARKTLDKESAKCLDDELLFSVFIHTKYAGYLRKGTVKDIEDHLNKDDLPKGIAGIDFLKYAYYLLIMGETKDNALEIIRYRYISDKAEGHTALMEIITLFAINGIYDEYNPRIIEELLLAMLPADLAERYRNGIREELEEEYEKKYYEESRAIRSNTMAAEYIIEEPDKLDTPESYVMHLFRYTMENMEDVDIQRVLHRITHCALNVALKGTSAKVRSRVFNNMPAQEAKTCMEDMDYMGPVRLVDVLEAQHEILCTIIKMIVFKELPREHFPYMEAFISDTILEKFHIETGSTKNRPQRKNHFRELYLDICSDYIDKARGKKGKGTEYEIQLAEAVILEAGRFPYDRVMRKMTNDTLGPFVQTISDNAKHILFSEMATCRRSYIEENYHKTFYMSQQGATEFLNLLAKECRDSESYETSVIIEEFMRLIRHDPCMSDQESYIFSESGRLANLLSVKIL